MAATQWFIVPCPRCGKDYNAGLDDDGMYVWGGPEGDHGHGALTEPEADAVAAQARSDWHNMEHEITGVCPAPELPHEGAALY